MTLHMLEQAAPLLWRQYVRGIGESRPGRPSDHYGALVRAIIGQQLSTRAAQAIYTRLIEIDAVLL